MADKPVRTPSIKELYSRYSELYRKDLPTKEGGKDIEVQAAEAFGALTHLRPLMVQLQEELDRQALELWFQLLLAEGKTVREARNIVHAKQRRWNHGTTRRIK